MNYWQCVVYLYHRYFDVCDGPDDSALSPVSTSVMIIVPGPNEFQAVQLYVDWKSDSITLLMVRVESTAPPSDAGLLCSTVYLSDRVPLSFSHTFSFQAHTCRRKHTQPPIFFSGNSCQPEWHRWHVFFHVVIESWLYMHNYHSTYVLDCHGNFSTELVETAYQSCHKL